jgi:hypothetical protein
MKLKFRGNYRRLQKCVSRTGLGGGWRDLKHGQQQYRTDDGGILNWWQSTGTITFQGEQSAAKELERAFISIASAKGRLQSRHSQPGRDRDEEIAALRKLLADALIENRKLKAALKQAAGTQRRS